MNARAADRPHQGRCAPPLAVGLWPLPDTGALRRCVDAWPGRMNGYLAEQMNGVIRTQTNLCRNSTNQYFHRAIAAHRTRRDVPTYRHIYLDTGASYIPLLSFIEDCLFS